MIDSPLIVKEWVDALYKNQSTNEYGLIDDDGNWRDANGNLNPHFGKWYNMNIPAIYINELYSDDTVGVQCLFYK